MSSLLALAAACTHQVAPLHRGPAAVPIEAIAQSDSLRVQLTTDAAPFRVAGIERAGPDSLVYLTQGTVARVAVPWAQVARIERGVIVPVNQMAAGRRTAWKVALGGAVAGALLGAAQSRPATGAVLGGLAGYWLGFVFGGQAADPTLGKRETRWQLVYARS